MSIGEIVRRLRGRRGLVALDSAAGAPRRFSWVAFDPLRGLALPRDLGGLRTFAAQLESSSSSPVPGPFQGGFIGALSYDLGVYGERAAHGSIAGATSSATSGATDRSVACAIDPWRSPRIVGGLYTDFIVRDEASGATWLVLGEAPGDGRASVGERRREIESLLASGASAHDPARASVRPIGPLVRHTSPREHMARIDRARELIAAGEFYQVNLAHRFTRTVQADPADLYHRLRAVNPAPFMAYFAWDRDNASGAGDFPHGALLSASPELLFELEGRIARTRPIKGTIARCATKRADDRAARALLASEKDRAELAMIVDLERNDLGRIARPGSVRVERMAHLESYASVHHLSADVVAELGAGVDAFDVLASLFPGGSITGAPKLASMSAIRALEGEGRGFFTGSAGFVDTRGRACFNILIRTLVWRPTERDGDARRTGGAEPEPVRGEVSFHVGGGITWSSIAADEDRETLAKGIALEAALEPDAVEHTAIERASAAPSPARRS